MKKYIILIMSIIILLFCPISSAKSTKQKIASNVEHADVVVAGSSSIKRWGEVNAHFSPYSVANLGVSGTKVEDWQKYHKYIAKCKPKAIVFYVGGNNITQNKSGLGVKTANKVEKLLKTVSKKNPKAMVYYVSIHPNPKRWNAWGQIKICNNNIKNWCKKQKRIEFIDITKYCLKNGKPNKDLFTADKLHFNKKGYERIWRNVVAAKVKKYLGSE